MKKFKLLPPRYFIISILLIPVLHFTLPVFKLIRFPFNLVGLILIIIGGIINLVADKNFKTYKTTVKPSEEPQAFITKGIFSVSRNPMYLGMVLILLGETMVLGSISPLVIVITFALIMHFVFIINEEKILINKFGVEYLEYSSSVHRWI